MRSQNRKMKKPFAPQEFDTLPPALQQWVQRAVAECPSPMLRGRAKGELASLAAETLAQYAGPAAEADALRDLGDPAVLAQELCATAAYQPDTSVLCRYASYVLFAVSAACLFFTLVGAQAILREGAPLLPTLWDAFGNALIGNRTTYAPFMPYYNTGVAIAVMGFSFLLGLVATWWSRHT